MRFPARLLGPLVLVATVHAAIAANLDRPVGDYVFMQVVAHPDDDLLFMNPDLMNTLGAELVLAQ